MATDGSLRFDTRIDESGFNRGIRKITDSAKGITATLKGLGAAMTGFLAVAAIKTMIGFANQAIELSSDMQEALCTIQKKYMPEDPMENAIMNYIAEKCPQYVCTKMLFYEALGHSPLDTL